MLKDWKTVAVQGNPGAYAHMAAKAVCGHAGVVFCPTFEDAFAAASDGRADGAVIPIENSTMGRIADIHHLLPVADVQIVGEYYLPVHHCLLGVKGAVLGDVKVAHSQLPALVQCRNTLKELGIEMVDAADTAGSAKMVAALGDKTQAAVASRLAGEIYGLDVLREPLNDEDHNTTRFVVVSKDVLVPAPEVPCKVSLMVRVRDIPAALYKVLGGFATNGINLTKLESYILDGDFKVAQFYVECEGHVEDAAMRRALEEMAFFSEFVKVLGCYRRQI